jgi:hypothetical protein
MPLTWKPGPEAKVGRWVVAQLDGGWQVACLVVPQGDELVIAELRLGAKPGETPAGGLGSREVQDVGIRGAVAAARDHGMRPGLFRDAAEPETARAFARSRKRRDRAAKLAAIALAYEQAVRDGRSDMLRAVAHATGLPYSGVRELVHAARGHEPPLLTGGGRGVSGGEATDAARRIAEGWWVAFAGHASALGTAHGATVVTQDGVANRVANRARHEV